jgi:acyl-ACP thioesterase
MNPSANKGYTETHSIYYDALNRDVTANYIQLMRIALETGSRHAASLGFDMDYFNSIQKGWVIMRWDVVFHTFPKWNETVAASTWPTSFKGFVGERAYAVNFPDGTPIMSAHSAWLMFDLQKRAACRPDKEHTERYGPIYPPAVTADFTFTDINSEGVELKSARAHTVRRSDIDTNGHVNNLRYICWAYDSTEAEYIKRLKVSYKKECSPGERVIIEVYESQGLNAVRIKNESGNPVAEIDIYVL